MSSKAILSRQKCPKCPSSDAYTVYDDGHGKCYSCGYFKPPNGEKEIETPNRPPQNFRPLAELFHPMADRKISADTVKKFKVTVIQDEDNPWHYVYPRFNKDGYHVGNKLRHRHKKDFIIEGDSKAFVLFGQNLFPAGGKTITVTEGQDDAMAVYEMFGSRYPVVSVDSVSGAARQVAEQFEYLNSFEQIVINFDKDEPKTKDDGTLVYPGQEAALAVAGMFPLGKVRILTLADAKDANDYKIKGWADRYVKEWWAAPSYTPAGLKLGKDMWDEISAPRNFETVPYPFDTMNAMTYGIRRSEVVLFTADTGVGKTQVLKEIEHHILSTTDAAIGFLHLEEPNSDTALGLMSITANKPLHLPDVRQEVTDDELRTYYDTIVNNDRVVVWDHFGSNSVDEVLAKIRHMHNLGCTHIVLDHLSIVVSDQSGDERKQLDEISTKLKMLCMELNIAVIAVIHQNRSGSIRGSAGPEQVANMVIKLSREKTDPDEWRRNVTKLVCIKNRFSGKTGPMTYLWYNEKTGRLAELDKEQIALYESGGSQPIEETW